jgi:ASCH domain
MSPKHPTSYSPVVRWTTSLARLPALSVRQPWPWLIVNGLKDIENRSRRTNHRGPLLIHAGLSPRGYTEDIQLIERKNGFSVPSELETGGIVGVVDVIDCVESHKSKWFEKGGFGWVLSNPRRLTFRPCKGAVGLFRPKC